MTDDIGAFVRGPRVRVQGRAGGPLADLTFAAKDLFDVAGEPTRAGSRIFADAASAKADAPVVRRLRAGGAVIVAKTNMTEFAYSGIGINPHYGTPKSVWNRSVGHVPGGSSSGAAVSVADGMAHGALGTDTGGSCRIPAALCGIVGFKPTAHRVPTAGAFPLSTSLDSIGPLAATVACCATLDGVHPTETVRHLSASIVGYNGIGLSDDATLLLIEYRGKGLP